MGPLACKRQNTGKRARQRRRQIVGQEHDNDVDAVADQQPDTSAGPLGTDTKPREAAFSK